VQGTGHPNLAAGDLDDVVNVGEVGVIVEIYQLLRLFVAGFDVAMGEGKGRMRFQVYGAR
jgi:hypothetical protein